MSKIFRKLGVSLVGMTLITSMLAGCNTNSSSTKTNEQEETEFSVQLPTGEETAEIFVEPVEGISDDFIRGMDASAVLVVENSGDKYYNFDGEEQDVFMTLAEAGVNYIRIRVWNDPYDENGNGYGGGNNDLATAIELGKRATKYGMKVCIDFHYSDFWADPKRQHAPKAWEGMSIDEKSEALYQYTVDSLTELLDAGVDVAMVQIGNEINYGMSGETSTDNVMKLLTSGSKGVREISKTYDKDIQVVVHYTRIVEPENLDALVSNLEEYEIDYDVLGLSFYPFWDGTMENMQSVVRNIRENYGKEVMIAETSYCYTSEDGDGCSNSLVGTDDIVEGYPATVQGQATMIRDVIAAANEAGAMGVFYWEGTWLPVGEPGADNSHLWEKYGSGWASSYAADYDPEDAGLYYGGCSWDNQAMFDFDGHPLASLNVFKYLKYGATTELAIDFVPDVQLTINVGDEIDIPDTVDVIYNDHSVKAESVSWDEEAIGAINTDKDGNYKIAGTLDTGEKVNCYIEIIGINYVLNPSFEDSDTSMWQVTSVGDTNPTDYQEKADDAYTGNFAFHFYSTSDMEFSIEQKFTDLEPGIYKLSAFAQGGDVTEGEMELYAITATGELTEPFMVTTWVDWKNPTISEIEVTDGTLTIGVRIKSNGGSWGTVDDFTLNKVLE